MWDVKLIGIYNKIAGVLKFYLNYVGCKEAKTGKRRPCGASSFI